MIRLFHVYFPSRTLLLALSEALVLVLAMLPAAFAVFGSEATDIFVYQDELLKLLLVVAVCMLCMHYHDLYDSIILHNAGQGATRVVQVLGSACVILACLYYIYPVIRVNSNLLMMWVVLAGISLIAWRRLFLVFNRSSRLTQKTLMLGAGAFASNLADEIDSRPELGLRLMGYVAPEPVSNGQSNHMAYLGRLEQMPELLERYEIQRVIVSMEGRREQLPVEPLLAAKARGVIVDDGPGFYEAVAGRVDLCSLRPAVLLFSDGFRASRLRMLYKRVASVILSSIGLIVTLPVMAVIAFAIRLESRGPVIFWQKRVGQNGKLFTLYKFRSMYDGADAAGKPQPAQHNDGRCTRIGKWLRRTHLDELPQLFNILRGDMHFVGPRPFAVEEEEQLAREIPFYSKRWTVRPGATGWAQVRSGYNETREDNIRKLSYDLYYIKNISIGLDFLIVLETVKILLLGRGGQ